MLNRSFRDVSGKNPSSVANEAKNKRYLTTMVYAKFGLKSLETFREKKNFISYKRSKKQALFHNNGLCQIWAKKCLIVFLETFREKKNLISCKRSKKQALFHINGLCQIWAKKCLIVFLETFREKIFISCKRSKKTSVISQQWFKQNLG